MSMDIPSPFIVAAGAGEASRSLVDYRIIDSHLENVLFLCNCFLITCGIVLLRASRSKSANHPTANALVTLGGVSHVKGVVETKGKLRTPFGPSKSQGLKCYF